MAMVKTKTHQVTMTKKTFDNIDQYHVDAFDDFKNKNGYDNDPDAFMGLIDEYNYLTYTAIPLINTTISTINNQAKNIENIANVPDIPNEYRIHINNNLSLIEEGCNTISKYANDLWKNCKDNKIIMK